MAEKKKGSDGRQIDGKEEGEKRMERKREREAKAKRERSEWRE